MSKKKVLYFWTSYSDLMSNLFFVMLVLFILTVLLLGHSMNVTQNQLDKIMQINKSIELIDSNYFEYSEQYKRHTLKHIEGSFNVNSSNIKDLKRDTVILINAGKSIVSFMEKAKDSIPGAEYLLIIEGQTSKDWYARNYELSYERALSLVRFWRRHGISFDNLPCELIISGSGQSSLFRDKIEKNNQRFVIHIIPKPGVMN